MAMGDLAGLQLGLELLDVRVVLGRACQNLHVSPPDVALAGQIVHDPLLDGDLGGGRAPRLPRDPLVQLRVASAGLLDVLGGELVALLLHEIAHELLGQLEHVPAGLVLVLEPEARGVRSVHLIHEQDSAVHVPELVLRVHQDEPALLGELGAALVELERPVDEFIPDIAHEPPCPLGREGLVVARLRLRRGGDDGLLQLAALDEFSALHHRGRDREAVLPLERPRLDVPPSRARQIPPHHHFHGEDLGLFGHYHVGVGPVQHVMGDEVLRLAEPPHRDRVQNGPLVGDEHGQHPVKHRDAVRGHQKALVARDVVVPHLALDELPQLGQVPVGQRVRASVGESHRPAPPSRSGCGTRLDSR